MAKNPDKMSLNKFNKLLRHARHGEVESIEELMPYVEKNARKTNQRMRALEDSGYDFYSYDAPAVALENLGRIRFRQKWNIDAVIDNWDEFEETARQTYRFAEMREHTTPTEIRNYSQKRLGYLMDAIGRQKTIGWSDEMVQDLNDKIYSIKKAVNFKPTQYKNESDEEFARRLKKEKDLMEAAKPVSAHTVHQLERAISSGGISTLFSQTYGITGEAFEAIYSAFESGVDYTQELSEKIYGMARSTKDYGGATLVDIIDYIRSLGE